MHYYQHHIGDFIRDTSRLSDANCMAYLRMIWLYYESEKPLPDNIPAIALKTGATEEAVATLLVAFFTLMGGAWHHSRCDAEIAQFKRMSDGGRIGAAKRWGKGSDSPPIAPASLPQSTPNANQEPITNNQDISAPDGFDEFYKAYPKKVGKPAAQKAFKSAKVNGHLPDLLADINRRLANGEWSIEKHQFIPNPATYLNQRRWEDEQPKAVSALLPGAI